MAGVTWRPISLDLEATIEQLNGLHIADQGRKANARRLLEAAVARLDDVTPSDVVDQDAPRGRGASETADRRVTAPDPISFVPLPQRTTHGGPFGPKVREKLVAEAIAKGAW